MNLVCIVSCIHIRLLQKKLKKLNPTGIIFSGGPNSVYDETAFRCDEAIFELGLPIFGICYGMQLMTQYYGGKVEAAQNREYGKAEIKIQTESSLFQNLPKEQIVWMSHGDLVVETPEGFQVDGTNASCPISAMSDRDRKLLCCTIPS